MHITYTQAEECNWQLLKILAKEPTFCLRTRKAYIPRSFKEFSTLYELGLGPGELPPIVL